MNYCPACGEETERLHEGYCEQCFQTRQSELVMYNSRYDFWEKLSDQERDYYIKNHFGG